MSIVCSAMAQKPDDLFLVDACDQCHDALDRRSSGPRVSAEAGATVHELEAMFGWEGGKMAIHYTKSANRKKLAIRGWSR